jgi:HEAT repeat protein
MSLRPQSVAGAPSRWCTCGGSLILLLIAMAPIAATPAERPPAQQTTVSVPLQQISEAVDSPDAGVRRKALRALRERGGPEPLPLLARLISDDEVGIREDAIDLVTRIYVEPPGGRDGMGPEEAFGFAPYRTTPWPVPPALQRALVAALADDYPSVRRNSAYALAIVAPPPLPPSAAFELQASLSDRDPTVRIAAARALGRLRVRESGVALVGRVNDEVLDVRLAAMRALGDMRETSAVPALVDQFEFYVRGVAGRAALDALARIGDPSSASLFEAQTGSGYPAHRRSAYEGLARTGTAKLTAPRIETALTSERDERVRLAMSFALASAGRPLDRVVDALTDDDVGGQALEYLVELAPGHAASIGARMRDQDPAVRRQIAVVLGFAGGQEAAAALQVASTTEPSAEVRGAIQVAQLRLRQLDR